MQKKSGEYSEGMLNDELKGIERKILIYGAHLVALECARWLIQNGKKDKIVGFAVTKMNGNPNELEGFQVKRLEEYENHCNLQVVIATPQSYHDEIERTLRSKGFDRVLKIGLEDMSKLKGEKILLVQKNYLPQSLVLEEDRTDPSWLNISEQKADTGDADWRKKKGQYYKFPTLFYLDEKTVFREALKFDFCEEYKGVCGEYRNLHSLPSHPIQESSIEETKKVIRIYMAFSMWDKALTVERQCAPWVEPIQVGSKLSSKMQGAVFDDMGDNISDMNGVFAEMTGAYWVWKNVSDVKYKGLCHYRRHFVISEEEILDLEQNAVDVILTTPRYVPGGIKNMFLAETPVTEQVYKGMLNAISELYPEDKKGFEAYMNSCFYYPNNMVIARNDVYNSYCSWMFHVLYRICEINEEINYGHGNDRHIAYAAEILTSYFFVKNKKEYCIAVTDYELIS